MSTYVFKFRVRIRAGPPSSTLMSSVPINLSMPPPGIMVVTLILKIAKKAKNYIEKLVKLTDSLTKFQYKVQALTGNGYNMIILKLDWKHY